jgi:hypothetical protein
MKKVLFFSAAAALCSFFLMDCSRSAPEIAFSMMALNYVEDDSGPVPTLTFFVIANDEDGYEDLAELRLYNDADGLLWSWTPEIWEKHEEDSKTWVGARNIGMAGGETFPSGQYRAVLLDKGGERTERTFGFDVPAVPRYKFPKLTINDGNYLLDCEYPEYYFICYGNDGAYRSMVKLSSKAGAISSVRLNSDIISVALWARDSEHSTSALTKMTAVR